MTPPYSSLLLDNGKAESCKRKNTNCEQIENKPISSKRARRKALGPAQLGPSLEIYLSTRVKKNNKVLDAETALGKYYQQI